MIPNPYLNLYHKRKIRIQPNSSTEEAEDLLRQVGFIYNTFGQVLKDVTKLLSFKYPTKVSINQRHTSQIENQVIMENISQAQHEEFQDQILNENKKKDNNRQQDLQRHQIEREQSKEQKNLLEKQVRKDLLQQPQPAMFLALNPKNRQQNKKIKESLIIEIQDD